MNNDDLKFLAGALALVISSVTVQINIATFVNRIRDECHQKRQVRPAPRFRLFSEIFDFLWAYLLGVLFNIVFYGVANLLWEQTRNSNLRGFGRFLWWLYVLNLVFWIIGMFIDSIRLWVTRGEELKTATQ